MNWIWKNTVAVYLVTSLCTGCSYSFESREGTGSSPDLGVAAESVEITQESMAEEAESFPELDQPDYIWYDAEGNRLLDLYFNPAEERGTVIYYEETLGNTFMVKCDIDSWSSGEWSDPAYQRVREGEEPLKDMEGYQEYTEYNDCGQIIRFVSEGIIEIEKKSQKSSLIELEFFYRDDGTLERKECHYNPWVYGTTGQWEKLYFDERERLSYSTSYITHGMISDYYLYVDGREEPAYCLALDHMGDRCSGMMIQYMDTELDFSESDALQKN